MKNGGTALVTKAGAISARLQATAYGLSPRVMP